LTSVRVFTYVQHGDIVTFEGGWNRCRCGTERTRTLTDVRLNNLVAFSIMERDSQSEITFKLPPTTTENEVFKVLLQSLRQPMKPTLIINGDMCIALKLFQELAQCFGRPLYSTEYPRPTDSEPWQFLSKRSYTNVARGFVTICPDVHMELLVSALSRIHH
jgi:hypothetical protein